MRRVITRVSLVVLGLLSATALHAQPALSSKGTGAPRLVRVTSVFTPADGRPAAPVETVTFAVYAEETGDAPLWQETQNVAVDAGRYTVLLGATLPEGLPLDLFASGDARWLGRRFERPGESEQARVLLTSVPYALKASDADTLGGRPASAYLLAQPDASDGPHATSGATGSTKTSAAGQALTAGNVNFVGKFVNTTDLGNSAMYETGGRVGVNTTTPFDALHARFTDNTGVYTGYAVQNLGASAASYSGMLFYDQNGSLAQFQGFNNSTHEYRINNIASGGSISFMLNHGPKFQVRPDGDVDIAGSLRLGGGRFLSSVNGTNTFLGNSGNVTTTGIQNTASGNRALLSNTTGSTNTASGSFALESNITGDFNVASGYMALNHNTAGAGNTASGTYALSNNTGNNNTAVGISALSGNGAGNLNVAVGYQAGPGTANGSNNIYLGSNAGAAGAGGESNVMYLGNQGTQTKTVIAGIRSITTGSADAVSVMIDSNGQLGTVNSSRRYKEDIRDMGEASSGLMYLRPVTYRYQQPYANGTKPIDYGLIAEEVEAVYPDLVAHLANGAVETVQYQKINAMLLNEVQKQHRTIEELKARLDSLERLLATETK